MSLSATVCGPLFLSVVLLPWLFSLVCPGRVLETLSHMAVQTASRSLHGWHAHDLLLVIHKKATYLWLVLVLSRAVHLLRLRVLCQFFLRVLTHALVEVAKVSDWCHADHIRVELAHLCFVLILNIWLSRSIHFFNVSWLGGVTMLHCPRPVLNQVFVRRPMENAHFVIWSLSLLNDLKVVRVRGS